MDITLTRALRVAAAAVLIPATLAAQVTVGGQVRPRTEIRDPVGIQDRGAAFTSMRTRAEVRAALESNVTAFVQIQDVRLWGEETSPLADFAADRFDLHQGWIQVASASGALAVRVGRQETSFAEERLVGPVGWTQQGQSFDGARVTWERGALTLDGIAFQIAESEAATGLDEAFWGGYGVIDVGEGRSLDLFSFYNRRHEETRETDQVTFGTRYAARQGNLGYRVEGALQTGDRDGRSVSASMVAAQVTLHVAGGEGSLTLWYDRLSGSDGTGEDDEAFSTLYATNHKFYGMADLFLNVPRDTGGRGLQDLALKGSWRATSTVSLGADLHHFRVVEDLGLGGTLANELDLTLRWNRSAGLVFQGGLSFIGDGEQMRDLGRLEQRMIWSYAMLTATF